MAPSSINQGRRPGCGLSLKQDHNASTIHLLLSEECPMSVANMSAKRLPVNGACLATSVSPPPPPALLSCPSCRAILPLSFSRSASETLAGGLSPLTWLLGAGSSGALAIISSRRFSSGAGAGGTSSSVLGGTTSSASVSVSVSVSVSSLLPSAASVSPCCLSVSSPSCCCCCCRCCSLVSARASECMCSSSMGIMLAASSFSFVLSSSPDDADASSLPLAEEAGGSSLPLGSADTSVFFLSTARREECSFGSVGGSGWEGFAVLLALCWYCCCCCCCCTAASCCFSTSIASRIWRSRAACCSSTPSFSLPSPLSSLSADGTNAFLRASIMSPISVSCLSFCPATCSATSVSFFSLFVCTRVAALGGRPSGKNGLGGRGSEPVIFSGGFSSSSLVEGDRIDARGLPMLLVGGLSALRGTGCGGCGGAGGWCTSGPPICTFRVTIGG
mmetsp:Transcript_21906/g.53707  ORF Transcript_21906/g.53707 Transcript_21906/m.53707 type:complete len:446 (-) Transcript_21906:920-2257(-)